MIEPATAWIVVPPGATPVARPPLVIVATAVLEEVHVTTAVRFCILLSLYVPVAVNCCVDPLTMVELAGVTTRDTNTGGVTVKLVKPTIAPKVAEIVALPAATPDASPAAVIVAAPVFEEPHVTELVRLSVLLSL